MSLQASENDREHIGKFTISFLIDFELSKEEIHFLQKRDFHKSQTVHLFYIVQSSNEVNRYIPGYLRVLVDHKTL